MRKPAIPGEWGYPALVAFAILVSAFLLTLTSLPRSLWIDELFTVRIASQPSVREVVLEVVRTERRPPVHYLSLHCWMRLVGDSDLGLRLFSIGAALFSLVVGHKVARELGGEKLALLFVYLMGCSPVFILYSPMVRAYSFTMALGLLSTLFFLNLRKGDSLPAWAGYLGSTALLVYTDYSALSLPLTQNMLVWLWPSRHSISRSRWVLGQIGIILLFLPWVTVIVRHVGKDNLSADMSGSPAGYLVKLAYPFHSFGLGETIFPWTWPGMLGLFLVAGLLVLGGLYWLRRRDGVIVGLFLLVPLGFTIAIISSVAKDITFLNVASRTFFALPYFVMVLAGGFRQVSRPHLRALLLLGLAVVWGKSLFNLYEGLEYHNPIYAVPARQVVDMIRAEAQPGDVIFSAGDIGFQHYYDRGTTPVPSLSSNDAQAALTYLREESPSRVWLLTFGRDRTRGSTPLELISSLEENYSLSLEQGYVEQDPTYRRVKELLLHRPAYRFKLLVRRYQVRMP